MREKHAQGVSQEDLASGERISAKSIMLFLWEKVSGFLSLLSDNFGNIVTYVIVTFVFGALPLLLSSLEQSNHNYKMQMSLQNPEAPAGWIYCITIATAVFVDITNESKMSSKAMHAIKSSLLLVLTVGVILATFEYSQMIGDLRPHPVNGDYYKYWIPLEEKGILYCIVLAMSFKLIQFISHFLSMKSGGELHAIKP